MAIADNGTAECFNCCKPIGECECGETYTYSSEDGAVCPYCGALNRAGDSDGILYDESTESYECQDCERVFSVGVHINHSWTCRRNGEA